MRYARRAAAVGVIAVCMTASPGTTRGARPSGQSSTARSMMASSPSAPTPKANGGETAARLTAVQQPPSVLSVTRGEDDLGPFLRVGRLLDGKQEGVWVELRGPDNRVAATHDYRNGQQQGFTVLWDTVAEDADQPPQQDIATALRPRAVQQFRKGKLHGLSWRIASKQARGSVLRFVEGRLAPEVGNIGEAPQHPSSDVEKQLRQQIERHRTSADRLLATARQQNLIPQAN